MTKMVKGYKIFFWVYCFLQMDSVYGLQTWHGRQGIKKKGDKALKERRQGIKKRKETRHALSLQMWVLSVFRFSVVLNLTPGHHKTSGNGFNNQQP